MTAGDATGRAPAMAGPGPSGAAADPVASPCVSVCTLDRTGTLCLGCYRTLDEIAAWGTLDPDARRAVLAALPGRRGGR